MADTEDFQPDWGGIEVKPGKYILEVQVKTVIFRDVDKEKPFMSVTFLTIDGDKKGFEFENRVYVNKKAEWRTRYFLKKFDYPVELLEGDTPVLRKKQIEGLQGKVLVDFTEDNYGMLRPDVKAFDHINGTELEEKLAKERAAEDQLPLTGAGTDAEPTTAIDVNADVRQEQQKQPDDLSMLD
jgi:hypothetical protein